MTPREAVAKACREAGEQQVALWCAELIRHPDWDHEVLKWIGGASLAAYRERDLTNEVNEYWLRVWGARALLYAWTPAAGPAVVSGLDDPAWRVREMCGKVARLRELGEAAEPLARLTKDEAARVRLAAVKALGAVGEGEHASVLHEARTDADMKVREAARSALHTLSRRLERPL
jgi:HEAT repeat protein